MTIVEERLEATAGTTKVVAISCRISEDKSGRREGVKAQAAWGTAYAAEAWPGMPVEVFADGDNSAMKEDGPRPEHDRFKQWLDAGRIAAVWSVEQSRLERDEVKWFLLAAQLEAAGIDRVHTKRDGIIDVRGEIAGIKAVLNAGEVRKLKKRLKDTLAHKAALGEPPGSKPFGYEHGRLADGTKTYVIVPEQAEAIRWAADQFLAGWSRANIAKALNERGLVGTYRMKVRDESGEVVLDEHGQPVTRPSKITAGTVTNMISNPTVAGYRVHGDRIIGEGNWEEILDTDTWQAVNAKLKAPHVVKRVDGGTYRVGEAHRGRRGARRYLTTGGLLACGVCHAQMGGSLKQMRNKAGMRSVPYGLCHPRFGGKACVGIMLLETEQYVVDQMLERLDRPEFLDAVGADPHGDQRKEILAKLDGIERQRDELAAMWAKPGELTMSEWQTARTGLAQHEQALRVELAQVPPPLVDVDLELIRETWPTMTLDEQREVLRLFVARVVIHRAKPGTKGFDPGRVVIEWQKR